MLSFVLAALTSWGRQRHSAEHPAQVSVTCLPRGGVSPASRACTLGQRPGDSAVSAGGGPGTGCLCHHLLDPHLVWGAALMPTVHFLDEPPEFAREAPVDVTVEERHHGAAGEGQES